MQLVTCMILVTLLSPMTTAATGLPRPAIRSESAAVFSRSQAADSLAVQQSSCESEPNCNLVVLFSHFAAQHHHSQSHRPSPSHLPSHRPTLNPHLAAAPFPGILVTSPTQQDVPEDFVLIQGIHSLRSLQPRLLRTEAGQQFFTSSHKTPPTGRIRQAPLASRFGSGS